MRTGPVLLVLILIATGLAAGPLADYNLNTYNSLVLNGSRCTGMGGAVVALGDEADDLFYNAAAAARRNKFQTGWFAWDYSLSFMNILAADGNDYRNAGAILPGHRDDDLSFLSLAVSLLFHRVAVSGTFSIAESTLLSGTDTYRLSQNNITINIAWEAIRKQLYLGIGVFVPQFEFKDGDDNTLAEYAYQNGSPSNFQLGAIYVCRSVPLSLGANVIFNRNGTESLATNEFGVDIPKRVLHPTTLNIGASWKFDLMPDKKILYTVSSNGAHKAKRLFLLKPEYLLVAASLKIVGTVDNALDILSFSDGTLVIPSGESVLL